MTPSSVSPGVTAGECGAYSVLRRGLGGKNSDIFCIQLSPFGPCFVVLCTDAV